MATGMRERGKRVRGEAWVKVKRGDKERNMLKNVADVRGEELERVQSRRREGRSDRKERRQR